MKLVKADLDTARWRNEAYWRARAPGLHLHDAAWWARVDGIAFSSPLLAASRAALLGEGYVQLDPAPWALPLDRMATLVSGLRQDGLPPILAWLYDEFWAAHRQLLPLSTALLDGPVASLPNFWAWCIDPQTAESGWQPHRDLGRRSLFSDGAPKVISYWLPLTAATSLNGCMYVVPADRDPTYNTEEEMSMRFALQDIRALPAEAGSILGWNQAIVHWGSRASKRVSLPRISLGIEHQRSDVEPFAEPLRDPGWLPTLEDRLLLIGRQLEGYAKFHEEDPAMLALARALKDE